MRQPIKFLPYFTSSDQAGSSISRFKGMSLNCKGISESWELSAIPGYESIVADGPDCGMPLSGLVAKYGERLVGRNVTARFGHTFPILLKLLDSSPADNDTALLPIIHVNDTPVASSAPTSTAVSSASISASTVASSASIGRSSIGPTSDSDMAETFYHTSYEKVDGERRITKTNESFMGMICIEGCGELRVDGIATTIRRGETLLLPAPVEEIDLEGAMQLLTVFIPAMT